jgi:signal transduction histidine kinase
MGMVLGSVATISILMLILYVMMKELVLRPVKDLKTSMQDFTKGEKTGTSVIRTGDELEDLGNSFIEMSESLIRYHTSLENEVQKATNSLEEANTRLTELNEKKSDFIAKISHELRTPMTSIKGAMDYISTRVSKISRTDKDAGDLMEFLDVIKNNADRLVRMVNDTLDIERIESGMFDLHFSEVDLIALIKEVIISFQSITGERNIIFKIVANPKVLITADEDRIRQVLINLVSNAINYSPDNAEIQFNVTESDKTVTVTLKDEGPGIPVEVQEKIFDKFYTIGKRYGTGLGLAICRGIIEMHNGEINVLKDIKKGSAIYFTLPKMV